MCKIVYKDRHGRVMRKELSSKSVRIEKVTAIGVYESGVRRSRLMSLRGSRSFSTPIIPFKG